MTTIVTKATVPKEVHANICGDHVNMTCLMSGDNSEFRMMAVLSLAVAMCSLVQSEKTPTALYDHGKTSQKLHTVKLKQYNSISSVDCLYILDMFQFIDGKRWHLVQKWFDAML